MTITTRNISILSNDTILKEALGEHLYPKNGYFLTMTGPHAEIHLFIVDSPVASETMPAINETVPMIFLSNHHNDHPAPLSKQCHLLIKPVRLQALLHLITQLVSESPKDTPIPLTDGYFFMPGSNMISHTNRNGERSIIHLTEKETALIKYLHDSNREVNKAELLESLWRYDKDADTHTIETHIYRLRQKMGGKDNANEVIITGLTGYRLRS